MKKIILILCLCLFVSAMATKPANSRETLEEFVKTMVPTCTLTDGYQCLDVKENDFLSRDSLEKLTPGQYLQAWGAAYEGFYSLPELSIEQKQLKHYRIGFTESQENYIILFMPLLLPESIKNGQPSGYGTTSYGKTIKFWIDKKSLQVSNYLFYK